MKKEKIKAKVDWKNPKKIREHHKNYMRNYYATHPDYRKYTIKITTQNNKDNPERTKSIKIKYNHSIKGKTTTKKYNNSVHGKDYHKKWKKNNPRSNTRYNTDLQNAMNNVRLRDNNTCQWYNCKLTHKEVPIHVHHIFPRKEYPDLELIEQYMICYCANHHGLFHRFRGDPYSEFISSRNSKGINIIITEDL